MRKALQILLVSAIAVAARAETPGGEDALAAYSRGDYKTALKLLGPMAEDGNTFAEFTIGKMYVYGEGVSKDPKKGAVFIKRAADKGLAIAQYHLARLYTEGLGVPQDPVQAALYNKKAAEQDDSDSQFALASQYLLGVGVPKDPAQAAVWFEKAARQNHPKAQYQLGVRDRDAIGVAKRPAHRGRSGSAEGWGDGPRVVSQGSRPKRSSSAVPLRPSQGPHRSRRDKPKGGGTRHAGSRIYPGCGLCDRQWGAERSDSGSDVV